VLAAGGGFQAMLLHLLAHSQVLQQTWKFKVARWP
jgi:hypothetical protein